MLACELLYLFVLKPSLCPLAASTDGLTVAIELLLIHVRQGLVAFPFFTIFTHAQTIQPITNISYSGLLHLSLEHANFAIKIFHKVV